MQNVREKVEVLETPRHKKLTIKQRKFTQHLAVVGNASEAARLAGYSERSAGAIAHETLKNPEIQSALEAALVEHGIDEGVFSQALGRLLSSPRGEDIARGLNIVLKVRGENKIKKNVNVNVSYRDHVRSSLNSNKANSNMAQRSQQPPHVEGGRGAVCTTVALVTGKTKA